MKRYIPALFLGLALCLVLSAGQGLFRGVKAQEVCRILSDGFFVAGVLIGGAGLLSWMSGQGQFNGFKYALYLAWNTFSWGYPPSKPMSYHDFRQQNPDKVVSARCMVIPGLVFLALAAMFLLLYHRV